MRTWHKHFFWAYDFELHFVNNLSTFNEQKIEYLVQIGANDGERFDELNRFIKEFKPKSVLVEPIDNYYQDLKKNYQNFDNVYFENSAISAEEHINEIYTVEKKYYLII